LLDPPLKKRAPFSKEDDVNLSSVAKHSGCSGKKLFFKAEQKQARIPKVNIYSVALEKAK